MCQTRPPMCPMRPRARATMSGPPANPSRKGFDRPGTASGIAPTRIPRKIPENSGMNWVSFSFRRELPSRPAAFLSCSSVPTTWSTSPNCRRRLGDRGHLYVAAGNARHFDAEQAFQLQLGDGFSEHAFVRNSDAPVGDVARRCQQVLVALASDQPLEL